MDQAKEPSIKRLRLPTVETPDPINQIIIIHLFSGLYLLKYTLLLFIKYLDYSCKDP